MTRLEQLKQDKLALEEDLAISSLNTIISNGLNDMLRQCNIEIADLELHKQIIADPENDLGYMHYVGYSDH